MKALIALEDGRIFEGVSCPLILNPFRYQSFTAIANICARNIDVENKNYNKGL